MNTTKTIIRVELDYYGNEDYGKRVFRNVDNRREVIWGQDFASWVNEMKEQGHTIVITNPDEVLPEYVELTK